MTVCENTPSNNKTRIFSELLQEGTCWERRSIEILPRLVTYSKRDCVRSLACYARRERGRPSCRAWQQQDGLWQRVLRHEVAYLFADEFKPDGLRSKLNKCDLAFKVEHVAFKVEQ